MASLNKEGNRGFSVLLKRGWRSSTGNVSGGSAVVGNSAEGLVRGFATSLSVLDERWQRLSAEEQEKSWEWSENLRADNYYRRWKRETIIGYPKHLPLNKKYVLDIFDEDSSSRRHEDWISKPIVICSVNLYANRKSGIGDSRVDNDDDENVNDGGGGLLPAEIGLAAFSVKDGLVDNFGRLIDPGDVPDWMVKDVEKKARQLGTFIPGEFKKNTEELRDYSGLLSTIQCFLEKHSALLGCGHDTFCVFALDSEFEMIHNCLKWLNDRSETKVNIEVLSLSLYAHLASTHRYPDLRETNVDLVNSPEEAEGEVILIPGFCTISKTRIPNTPLTTHFKYPEKCLACIGLYLTAKEAEKILLETTNYKYLDETCCVYHRKKMVEVDQCALNRANRYAFNLLEVLTLSNEVDPIIPGSHFPEVDHPKKEWMKRYDWLDKWGFTELERCMGTPPEEDKQIVVSKDRSVRRHTYPRVYSTGGKERKKNFFKKVGLFYRPREYGPGKVEEKSEFGDDFEDIVTTAMTPTTVTVMRRPHWTYERKYLRKSRF